jgi:hypothetical protein
MGIQGRVVGSNAPGDAAEGPKPFMDRHADLAGCIHNLVRQIRS